MDKNKFKIVKLNNFPLISCNLDLAGKMILDSIEKEITTVFVHINLYNYYLIVKKKLLPFQKLNNTILFFEGIGMKTGSFLSGRGINEDINGTDLAPKVFEELKKRKKSIYLLGAKKAVVYKAVEAIKKEFPGINICGYHHGFFNNTDEAAILNDINRVKPDILLAGMGIMREINFVFRNLENLDARVIWNVGGLFDFLSEILKGRLIS